MVFLSWAASSAVGLYHWRCSLQALADSCLGEYENGGVRRRASLLWREPGMPAVHPARTKGPRLDRGHYNSQMQLTGVGEYCNTHTRKKAVFRGGGPTSGAADLARKR